MRLLRLATVSCLLLFLAIDLPLFNVCVCMSCILFQAISALSLGGCSVTVRPLDGWFQHYTSF